MSEKRRGWASVSSYRYQAPLPVLPISHLPLLLAVNTVQRIPEDAHVVRQDRVEPGRLERMRNRQEESVGPPGGHLVPPV
eukprot:3757929-Pyramimonas_sp.AAC.1